MNWARLILREITFRKLNFGLAVLSVAAAAGCLVAQLTLLRLHDVQTQRLLAAREAEVKQMMARLQDDYRKIMLKLGFNILILPAGASLNDLHNDEQPPRLMPEEYAHVLASNRVMTINHVLPALTQKVKWPERQRKVILMGVKGEVFIQSPNQKPLLESVPPGHVVVGYELHQSLGLKTGQKLTFMGREFTIAKLMEEKGNADDITLWINLHEAQQLLQMPGQINAILALECNCEADRLAKIRAEIGSLLPGTRVIEFASQAITRAEARNRAAEQALASLQHEKEGRARLRAQQEAFAAWLIPVVLTAAVLWIALLTWLNVRDRRPEIGLLRALGVRAGQVLGVFIGRAAVSGLAGAVLGVAAGLWLAWRGGATLPPEALKQVVDWGLLLAVLAASPLLAAAAAWVPALVAAQQDPAHILREG
ncbi:MAG: FtsX-like permease family protein [Verrucomicrobiae bacterium]|nr:FtsX-like permease family protein [Verrucomicrobiae bacterium]